MRNIMLHLCMCGIRVQRGAHVGGLERFASYRIDDGEGVQESTELNSYIAYTQRRATGLPFLFRSLPVRFCLKIP